MSPRVTLGLALALMLLGAVLVLTDIRDIWLAREFWRDMRRPGRDVVPDFWDDRYLLRDLTLLTPKIVGGGLVGGAGAALAVLGGLRRRGRQREG